jgi:hypothetical protein
VCTVDHRLALNSPALVSAPSKKLSAALRVPCGIETGRVRLEGSGRYDFGGTLGAFYRRLSSRIGKAKAVTATARKVAVLFYNAVRHGMEYVDPGASSYETRYRTRVVNNLHAHFADGERRFHAMVSARFV